ncbi:MAG TPA: hypothetical protein VJB16_02375 [archaeon]|nr:hypothetical protein [archaeon]
MRGLLDWKVIVALLVALAIAYAVFGGSGDLRGLAEKALGKAQAVAGGAQLPIPSFGSAVPVRIRIDPDIEIAPDRPVDVEVGSVRLQGFRGTITTDKAASVIRIRQEGSSLEVVAPLENVTFPDFSMDSFSVEGAAFTIEPNVTAANASLALRGFRGTVTLGRAGALLEGNVTELRTSIGGREWQLK